MVGRPNSDPRCADFEMWQPSKGERGGGGTPHRKCNVLIPPSLDLLLLAIITVPFQSSTKIAKKVQMLSFIHTHPSFPDDCLYGGSLLLPCLVTDPE